MTDTHEERETGRIKQLVLDNATHSGRSASSTPGQKGSSTLEVESLNAPALTLSGSGGGGGGVTTPERGEGLEQTSLL